MSKFASHWMPAALVAAIFAAASGYEAAGQDSLGSPGFHHLHLNSVNPDAAIAFYTKEFPSTSKTEWGGYPALRSPNNVLVLFTKLALPPIADPQATAFWHFVCPVTDVRKS